MSGHLTPANHPSVATRTLLVVSGLLVLHVALLVHSARVNFATVDEVGHLAAGISHWQTGTYSMYRVNPPLARMLAVLPVLAASPDTGNVAPSDIPVLRNEWTSGMAFADDNAGRYCHLIWLSRLAGVGWSVLGGLLVFFWARELYGVTAGCLALGMWCLSPTILAFAPLLTPDVPATVAGLAATYAFWHYLRSPSWSWACLSGLLLGVAQLTKFTLLLLYGVWPLLWLHFWLSNRNGSTRPGQRPGTHVAQGLWIVLVSLLVINLGYEFRGSFRRLGDFPFVSETLSGQSFRGMTTFLEPSSGNRFRNTWLGSVPVPVPDDFLRGIDVQRRDFERLRQLTCSYRAGEWRASGWWYYYLYALAVKVPLGIWVLVLWSFLTLSGHPSSGRWRDEVTLWLPALAVLILVSSQTEFNHHMRYVLPMFPFVLISTGKLAYFLRPQRWRSGLVVLALLGWAATSSLRVYPHSLSYFNELAGGPDRGHDHLVDSNIDWGQDLLFLKHWLDEHPEARPLGLAYFNIVDPRIVGIEFTLPPFGPTAGLPADEAAGLRLGPQPGYYAVSVNYLRGSSFIKAPNGKGERTRPPLHAYAYFRQFTPIARAGYSIYVYHLTVADANRVRHAYGLPLLSASRQHAPAQQGVLQPK